MNNTNSQLKFAVLTDVHYYSKKNGVEGTAYYAMSNYNQKLHGESSDIINRAWEMLCQDKETEIILIHGDLTNNGAIESHKEFRLLLRELVSRGKRVFVTFSTHDYQEDGKTKGYQGDTIIDIPSFKYEDVKNYYDEFGFNQAISSHRKTGSYVVQLDERNRLLALNDDFGTVRSGYSDECMEWIREQVDVARRDNQYIFAMAHHPIIAPSPVYKIMGKNDIIEQSELRLEQLSDMGINLYFNGHSHIHSVLYHITNNNRVFYNISTGALVGYPPTIRKIIIDNDKSLLDIDTQLVDNVEDIDTKGLTLIEYLRSKFVGLIEDVVESGAKGDMARVKDILVGISVTPQQVHKHRFLIKFISRRVHNITYYKIIKWTRSINKLKLADYESYKDKKALPLAVSLMANLYDGNSNYEPQSLEYKMIMGVIAIFDSILRCIPINICKKLGVSCLSELVEPLVYNYGMDNHKVKLYLDNDKAQAKLEDKKNYTPPYRSYKGIVIVSVLFLSSILFSPIIIPSGLIYLIVKGMKKIFCKKDRG